MNSFQVQSVGDSVSGSLLSAQEGAVVLWM